MRTSMSNLTGEQQNSLHHLAKALKRALNPIAIICYGHQANIDFQYSVFSKSGTVKNSTSVFDIFLMLSDADSLPDPAVLEIAKRCFPEHIAGHVIVFRRSEVLSGLKNGNRFFSCIFRKGVLLYGNKNAMPEFPGNIPSSGVMTYHERQQLSFLLQQARQSLFAAELNLKTGMDDIQSAIGSLHECVIFSLRYFIGACWGTELRGDLRDLLTCTSGTDKALARIFPCNTTEEAVLFDVLNLSLIDQGFSPGDRMVQTLFKRASGILAISRRAARRKMAELLPS